MAAQNFESCLGYSVYSQSVGRTNAKLSESLSKNHFWLIEFSLIVKVSTLESESGSIFSLLFVEHFKVS